MRYGDALEEIETALQNAGLRATTEPSKLHLPGALIVPGTMSFEILDQEDYVASIDIYLLTANKGSIRSLNDLQDMLTILRGVFVIPEAEPITLDLNNISKDPIPGLLINLQATITKD